MCRRPHLGAAEPDGVRTDWLQSWLSRRLGLYIGGTDGAEDLPVPRQVFEKLEKPRVQAGTSRILADWHRISIRSNRWLPSLAMPEKGAHALAGGT